ncbi:hypothetical protein LEMLEM_LOCUS16321, partial [Lemmus lemmus]
HHPSSCAHRTKHPDPAQEFKLCAVSLGEQRTGPSTPQGSGCRTLQLPAQHHVFPGASILPAIMITD